MDARISRLWEIQPTSQDVVSPDGSASPQPTETTLVRGNPLTRDGSAITEKFTAGNMNVKVRMSANITSALVYGRNPDKGGEYILYNCLDPTLSPEEQAEDWKAMSRGYKNKVCQIIISFSDKDTERIRQMRGAARINYERQLLLAFFKNLAERGNDVTKAPFGVFHHGNTDNEHFHVYVLMTDLEGKRWDNSFIGKNATRAAAKVSMDFGLEGCPKSMTRELAHQRHTGKIPRTLQDVKQDSRKRKYDRTVDAEGHIHRDRGKSGESSVISERLRRQRSIQEADKRKRMYKYLIEKAAVNADTSEFLVRCKAQGITIFLDPKLGVSMFAVDNGGRNAVIPSSPTSVSMPNCWQASILSCSRLDM